MGYKFNPFTGNLDEVGAGGAGSTPGGSDTQVQFNDGGSFGGSADLTWDDTAKELGVGGDINLDDGGTYATTLQLITPTANRTISFPDATGTVGLVGGSSGQLVYNNAGAYAGAPSTSVGVTGDITLSLNGAASTPPLKLTGTWFSGGTSTTTKPQLLIEPTGTTSTAWSTSGTGLGVNAASGFSGNLLDLQANGTSKFKVAGNTDIAFVEGNVAGRTSIVLPAYSNIQATNSRLWIQDHNGTVRTYFENGLEVYNLGYLGISAGNPVANPADVRLYRDAANTLAQRNSTNAQTYRLYNTYTDASNYQRTSITDDSTGLVIDQQYAGTGAARTNLLDLKDNGTSQFSVSSSGNIAYTTNRVTQFGTTSSQEYQWSYNNTVANAQFSIRTSSAPLMRFVAQAEIGWVASTVTVTALAPDLALVRAQAGVLALTDGSTGTGYLKQTPVAVSALPAAATVGAGTRGFVSDSTVAASGNFGATVTGGGSNNVPVFSDGTNWLIG